MNNKKSNKKSFEKRKTKLKKEGKKFGIEYTQDNDKNMEIDDIENGVINIGNMNLDNIDINNLPDINEVLKKQGINTTKTITNEENTITPIDDNLNQNYLNKVGKFWSKNEIFSPSYIRGNVEILKNNKILSNLGNKLKILDGDTFEMTNLDLSENSNKKHTEITYENEEFVSYVFLSKKEHLVCCMDNSLVRVFELNFNSTSGATEENFNTKINTQHKNITLIKTIKLNKAISKKMIVDSTQKYVALVMSDKTITVIDTENYNIVSKFVGHSMFINDIIFNPIKKSFQIYSGAEDGVIKVWDILLGK